MMEDVGDDSVTPAALPSLFSHSSLFFLFFGRLFLDAHLVVTLFVNKLIHRILRHAHLPIIRNDHSINATATNQPTNQPSIINANRTT
jgi:hypothetical protein